MQGVDSTNIPTYEAFVEFTALPREFRGDDMKNIRDFANANKLSEKTLYDWKRLPHFWEDVRKCYDKNSLARLSTVKNSLMREAIKGDVSAIKLYLQYEEKWNEKFENKLSGGVNITDFLKARKSVNGDNGTGTGENT